MSIFLILVRTEISRSLSFLLLIERNHSFIIIVLIPSQNSSSVKESPKAITHWKKEKSQSSPDIAIF